MSTIAYPKTSAYAATPQTSWYIGRLVFRPVTVNSADQRFVLEARHQYRPDRLAYELYQTPTYWWVFCERNPFLRSDPIWNFITGLEIMVPSADYLQRILGA